MIHILALSRKVIRGQIQRLPIISTVRFDLVQARNLIFDSVGGSVGGSAYNKRWNDRIASEVSQNKLMKNKIFSQRLKLAEINNI